MMTTLATHRAALAGALPEFFLNVYPGGRVGLPQESRESASKNAGSGKPVYRLRVLMKDVAV